MNALVAHRVLASADAVIAALGGVEEAARAFDAKPRTVQKWKQRGHFPPRFYVDHTRRLAERGWSAAPSLWKQVELAA